MLLYCIMVFIISIYPIAGIVEMTAFAGAVFAASFFPAIFGGLYLRWGTDVGALVSMITGMVVNIVWRFGLRYRYDALNNIHEIIPAFVVALLVYLVVSKITGNRMPDEDHLRMVFRRSDRSTI